MKILHVITSLYTGGAEVLIVNLVPRFQALGHEVGVVVFNGDHTPLMERLEKECPDCKIYKMGNSFYNPWYIVKLIRVMQNYDVVHTHNSSPQLFAAIANVFCNKRIVTTEHNTSNRKRGNRLLRLMDKWMYAKYDKIICISDQAETNLRQHLNVGTSDKSRIITIYNGIDIQKIRNATPLENLKTNRFLIVMVAAYRPQKDQATLVRTMTKLPHNQYEAWLVGDGECQDVVEKLVKRLDAEDYVKILGVRTDVPRILKTADVVVMSTHYEGLSLSNIEGMAAGKPFVASDVEGIQEVTKGYGVLVPHEDAEALAKVIQRLHDDQNYYHQIAARCNERAKQFDIRDMASNYNNVYLSLL